MTLARRVIGYALVVGALTIAGCGPQARASGGNCPFTECDGECVDTSKDVANCGGCGASCSTGEVCSAGLCALSCPTGLIDCGGGCVDPLTDRMHCGASADCAGGNAGDVCEAGELCDGSGTCELACQPGLVACGGTCVDPNTDEAHCGASGDCEGANAGTTCDPGERCDGAGECALSCQADLVECSGTCIDPDSNPMYCGASTSCAGFITCDTDEACVEGNCVEVLAIPPCTLYAIDSSRAIYTVNKTTAALTLVATADATANLTAGLTYRPDIDTVYVSSTTGDTLARVDVTTGTVNVIGVYTGATSIVMHGLEWNPQNQKLYGMSSHNAGLYQINPATGAETLIGLSGTNSFGNLGFDSRAGIMYMTSSGTDSSYIVDLVTGAATLLGPLSTMTNPNALAFDPENNVMYVLDSTEDELGVLDRTTGAVTTIGSTSGNLLGLACVP